jgi:hypothetical protein
MDECTLDNVAMGECGFFPKNRISGEILVARQFAVQTAQIIRIVANPIQLQSVVLLWVFFYFWQFLPSGLGKKTSRQYQRYTAPNML